MKIKCPYCKSQAVLKDASVIYFRTGYGQIYQCQTPACDSYVGVHTGTTKPKGSLAQAPLRNLRKAVHAVFDPIWMGRPEVKRSTLYKVTARILNMKEFHIGEMREKDAQAFLDQKDVLIPKIKAAMHINQSSNCTRRENLLKVLRKLYETSKNSSSDDYTNRTYLGDVKTIQACVDSNLAIRIKKSVSKEIFYTLTRNGYDALKIAQPTHCHGSKK